MRLSYMQTTKSLLTWSFRSIQNQTTNNNESNAKKTNNKKKTLILILLSHIKIKNKDPIGSHIRCNKKNSKLYTVWFNDWLELAKHNDNDDVDDDKNIVYIYAAQVSQAE